MHRKTLLASALAVLMAGSTSFVMAQNTPPATPSTAMTAKTMHPAPRHHGDRSHNMRRHRSDHRHHGVIGDLRGLEKLYTQAGRSKEMTAVYNDVLAQSQNPHVRNYVYQRLARLQAQPTDVDQAIKTLRKGLDESLANDTTMRAEREKMRAAWQQRRADATPRDTNQ